MGRSLKTLLDSAVLNIECFRGSFQDQSKNALVMTADGTAIRRDGAACLYNAPAGGTISRVPQAPLIDINGSFTLEEMFKGRTSSYILRQGSSAAGEGGYLWLFDTSRLHLYLYNNGTLVRVVSSPVGSCLANQSIHVVLSATGPAVASALLLINGIPHVVALGGAGIPLNVTTALVLGGPGTNQLSVYLARKYPSALTPDEMTTLYEASRRIVTPQSTIVRSFPERYAIPGEPGVAAHYLFRPEELAQGRYLDYSGNGLDLTTKTGVPRVGPDGGVLATTGNSWGRVLVPVGNANFAYSMDLQMDVVGTAWTLFCRNGGHYIGITAAGGDRPFCAFDGGGTIAGPAYPIVGRGPVRCDFLYDGTNEVPVLNGVASAAVAVVPNIGAAATVIVGGIGLVRLLKVFNVRRTVAQARADYVRDFARDIIHSWRPVEEGETNTVGLLTGVTLPHGGHVPLGAASLRFEWLRDLSDPEGGRLGLTDTGAISMRRVDYPHAPRPAFGAWLVRYRIRDEATDEMIFALTPRRGVDPTLAGSGSYWVHCRHVAGPWWRQGLHYENGAQIDAVDFDPANVPNGTDMLLLVNRLINGDWQLYSYSGFQRTWGWTQVVGNNVAQLNSGCVTIAPRGSWVTGFVRYQGEMTPHELPA